jgi:hypothetical protein
MKPIFGAQTQRLLAFVADLRDLSPAEVDRVASAWKQVRGLDRAETWAQLQRVTTQHERFRILAAASTARRTAMDTARRLLRPDWAFWAAAWDAAAAIIADDRIGRHYHVLTAPLATVMPSLARARYAAHAPAPRLPPEPVRSRSGYP